MRLDNQRLCVTELERCSTGMAQLTQEATANAEALSEIEGQYQLIEAAAGKSVRENTDEKLTAGEITNRINELIANDPELGPIRLRLRDLQAAHETLARRLKTLEKRSMNALGAAKLHDSEARNAGFTGETNMGGRSR